MLEDQHRQWRQAQVQRLVAAVRGHRHGVDPTQVADAAAAVQPGVAVEQFAPTPGLRHADQVVVARHRCEIGHHEHRRAIARLAQEGQHKQLMLRFDKQSQELNRLREVVRASSQTGASAAGSQGTLVQLQAEIDQTELAVHRLLPPPEAAPLVQAMSHLLRRYPGLTLVKTTALAAGTSLTSAAASKDLPSGLKRQGMEVTVAGNYADLTRFVSTIEAAMPYVRWGLMTLKTTDDQTAPQLTLQLFLLTEVPS